MINNLTTRVDAAIEALEKGSDSMSVRRRIIVILRDLQATLSPPPLPSEEVVRALMKALEKIERLDQRRDDVGEPEILISSANDLHGRCGRIAFEALAAARATGYGESSDLSPREGG